MSQAPYEDIATNTDVIPTQKIMQDLMTKVLSLKAQVDQLTAAMEPRSPSSPMPSASVPYSDVTGLSATPLCDITSVPTIPILTQLSVREVLIWQEGLTTLDFQHSPMPVDPVHYVEKSVLTSALNKLRRSTISAASAFSIHYNSDNIHKIDANNLNLLLFHTLVPASKTEFKALFNSSIRFKPLEEAFQPQQLHLATLLDATLSYLKDVSLFHRFLTQGCTTPAQELKLDYLPLMTDAKQGYISMVLNLIPHDYGSTLLNLLDPAVLKRTRFLEDFLNLLRQQINYIYPTVQAEVHPSVQVKVHPSVQVKVHPSVQVVSSTVAPAAFLLSNTCLLPLTMQRDSSIRATTASTSVATPVSTSLATPASTSVATPVSTSVATPNRIPIATPTRTAAKDQVPRDAPQLPRGVTQMARDPSAHTSDSNKYQLSSSTNINAIWLQDPYEHHDSSSQYLMWHHPQSFVPTGLMVTIPKATVIYCPVPTYMYRPHTNLHTPSIGRLTNSPHVLEDTYSVDPSFFPLSVATPVPLSAAYNTTSSVATPVSHSVATPVSHSVATPDAISVADPGQIIHDSGQLSDTPGQLTDDIHGTTRATPTKGSSPLSTTISTRYDSPVRVPSCVYQPREIPHAPPIGMLTNCLHVLKDTYSGYPSFFPLPPQPHDTTLPWSSPLELAPEEIDTPLSSNHPNLLELPAKPNIPDSLRSRCRPVPPFCTTYVPHAAIRLFHLHNYVRVKNRTN
jgi:hypothetical protein